jgi:Flp pilus assembly protein CpaB
VKNRAFLFALISAVATSVCAYIFISDLEIKYKKMNDPLTVVVASKKIKKGAFLQPNMVSETGIPKEYIQPKAFLSEQSLFSTNGTAMYVALADIEESEQILMTKTALPGSLENISSLIPENKKALPVKFDPVESTVLKPGSVIDIYAVIDYVDNNKEKQESIFLIAQNILTLSVGNTFIGEADSNKKEETNADAAVTLSVSDEEAQKILLVSKSGKLKFVIRPNGSDEISDIKPLKLSAVTSSSVNVQKIQTKNQSKNIEAENEELLEILGKYSDN